MPDCIRTLHLDWRRLGARSVRAPTTTPHRPFGGSGQAGLPNRGSIIRAGRVGGTGLWGWKSGPGQPDFELLEAVDEPLQSGGYALADQDV